MSLEQKKPEIPEIFEQKPGLRLITQNLLASAALFENPMGMNLAENPSRMNLTALEDLCNIIDAFSLCDQVCLFNHEDISQLPPTVFFDALRDTDFITSINPSPGKIKTIIQTATTHLGTALNIDDTDMFINLFEHALLVPEFHAYNVPDGPYDFEAGALWLSTAPKVKDLVGELWKEKEEKGDYIRQTTFVARTFLYLACAEEYKLALRPDMVRYGVLTKVAAMEGQFRSRLVKVLKERYADFVLYGNQELRQKVSPCAAIVFQRAGQDKGNIPREMMKLRNELASTRKHLHELEGEIFDPSADKGRAASEKWDDIMKELAESFLSKATFRSAWLGEKVKRLRRLLGVSLLKDIIAVGTKPVDVGAWIQLVLDLPSEKAVQLLARGPIMDLYRVLTPRQLYNPAKLSNLVVPLFGEQVLRKTDSR